MIGAGLFVRTLSNLHAIDVGFNRENILLVSINGRQAGYRDAALARFYAGLLDRFREIPGVRAATRVQLPAGGALRQQRLGVHPRPDAPAGRSHRRLVCMSIRPSSKPCRFLCCWAAAWNRAIWPPPPWPWSIRNLRPRSSAAKTRSAASSRSAKPAGPLFEIVGVAKAAHYNSLQEEAQPVIYIPYTQDLTGRCAAFVLRATHGGPSAECRGGRPPHCSRRQFERLHHRSHHPGAAHRADHFAGAHLRGSGQLVSRRWPC